MERKAIRKKIRYIAVLICALLLFPLLPHQSAQAAGVGYGDRFGYTQLTTDAQKRAYTVLEDQIANVSEFFIVKPEESITLDDMEAAADALTLDRMDFFYFTYGNMHIAEFEDGTLAVNPRYILHKKATPGRSLSELAQLAGKPESQISNARFSMLDGVNETPGISLEEIRVAKGVYEARVKNILQSIPTDADTIQEKVKYLHDYLANNIVYQKTVNDQNAYSAIVEGKTVCAGYAKAYQDLLTRLSIKCWYISGYARQPHAWNVLWLDGECVYTDVTWADQETYIQYGYYNISKEKMEKDHTMDPEYAAVLGGCNHNDHQHQLTAENVAGAVAMVMEEHFPAVGNQLRVDYSKVSNSITFHSSDPGVVTVTDSGLMTAVGNGSAVITILLHDQGCAHQYQITVGTPHQHSITSVPEVPATCCAYGYKSHYVCSVCGDLFADAAGQQPVANKALLVIPYNDHHIGLTHVKGIAATCTADGTQDYWYCSDCGDRFLDSNGNNQISNMGNLRIPATGHNAGAWQHDAGKHWNNCQACTWYMADTAGSHTDSDGNYQCDTCGYSMPLPETTPTQPTETTPPPTQPTVTVPIETTPVPTQPTVTVPIETTPVPTQPTVTVPIETTPAPTQPTVTIPIETTPAPTQPTETKPAPTQPTETVPIETTPVPTKPSETGPSQTQPTGSQPTEESTTATDNAPENTTSAAPSEQEPADSDSPAIVIVLCVIVVLLGLLAGTFLFWKYFRKRH